ncbi:MAG: hypothetical protein A3K22_02835 [Deltaproteobacteria bacterium RBG_16_42_7]|nr:MAG: hypothetical protein A3K22_02835 [Deltaproteobacteria bacterium RBG_16_42_7]
MTASLPELFYKPAKVGIHFWRSACYINSGDVSFFNDAKAYFHGILLHYLFSVRPRINMAVLAELITEPSNIHLKYSDAGCCKRVDPTFRQDGIKGFEMGLLIHIFKYRLWARG